MLVQRYLVEMVKISISASLKRSVHMLRVVADALQLKWNSIVWVLLKDEVEDVVP